MSPRMRSGLPPRFAEEISDEDFEALSCDLFGKEEGIRSSELYGRPGQRQHGIDILACRRGTDELEVGQCKRVAIVTLKILRDAMGEFLTSWSHWEGKKVKRFIIFLACSLRDTHTQNAILEWTRELAKHGVALEVWGDTRLVEKLRPWPDIVERRCGIAWVKRICGTAIENPTGSKALGMLASISGVESLLLDCTTEFRESCDLELPRIRELARCGQVRAAFEQIESFRESPRWKILAPREQAQVLRLAASLYLDYHDDLKVTKELLQQARAIEPSENFQVLDAVLRYREAGCTDALGFLAEPHDVDAWNVKLAFLIELGRSREALTAVEQADFSLNGGTLRIASIAALLENDWNKAQAFAQEALRVAPQWFQVRLHAAKMKYLSAILPHFPMRNHLDWPIPPDWEYIRLDTESIAMFRTAEEEFRQLLNLVERDDAEKAKIEGWRLACLANDFERRDEAETFAQELLLDDPAHLPATVWSLQRGFRLDSERVQESFSMHANGTLTPDSAQALCTIHFQGDRYEEAVTVLNESKQMFESRGLLFAWRFARAQIAAGLGASGEADKFLEEETDPAQRRDMQIAVLRITARKMRDFTKLVEATAKAYEETQTPKYLFEACEASIEAESPQFVADHIEELLTHFPTCAGLQLAVRGCFNAARYALCLKLLREHRSFFSGEVPPSMKRVEIECLRQVGELAASAEQAEKLARSAPDTENLISLFQTQVTLNDFRATVVTVRELLKRPDITSLGLLQMARAIHVEDEALAAECWQEAVRRGVADPTELLNAVELAFRLGLESEARPLMPTFIALAQKPNGPVQAKPLDEIRELMRLSAERQGDINRKYNECELPAHLAVNGLNCTLAVLYHDKPSECRADGGQLRHFPVMIRHGARLQIGRPQVLAGSLFADITSIMLAADVGLLEVIEKTFSPILISAHLPESLRQQIEKVSPGQPRLEERRKTVVEFVEANRITVVEAETAPVHLMERYSAEVSERWGSLIARAQREGGLFCGFAPPLGQSGQPVHLENEELAVTVSCGDVVHALFDAGAISAAEADEARQQLGETAIRFNHNAHMIAGNLLVLDKGLAEQFAGAGILDALAAFACIEICEDDIQTVRAESKVHSGQVSTVAWLKALAERIHRGIQRDIYHPTTAPGRPPEEDRPLATPEEKCLFDLLAAKSLGAKVTWCDDRFMNRYERVSGLPNYSVYEILRSLRNSRCLSADRYFAALLHLRESNVRYLPIEADELRYHLLRAPITAQGVQETPALATMRRYFAACCLDKARMRPPGVLNGRQILGEFTWVADSMRAASETMAKLWAEPAMKESERRTRAEWLLNELIIPFHGVAEAQTGLPQPQNGAEGVAGLLALLFACGFTLESPWKRKATERGHARARYYHWLGRRLIKPMFQIEPHVVAKVIAHESESLLRTKSIRKRKTIERQMLRGLAIRAWLDLPRLMQNQMKLDAEERKWLGLTVGKWTLGVFGREFDFATFWRAVSDGRRKGSATVTTIDGKEEFTFTGFDGPNMPRRIPIRGPGLPTNARLVELKARVLDDSLRSRRSFLEGRLDWFDIGAERRRKKINEIVRMGDPARRIREVEAARDESSEHFYRSLLRHLRCHESVAAEESLPPSAASLCDHLRLRDEDFSPQNICLDACASRLIKEVGLAWTIERFATLPLILPEPIWIELRRLKEVGLRMLFARLQQRLVSPVCRLHLVHLLADRAAVLPSKIAEVKELIASLLDEDRGRENWKTFNVILEWTRRCMQSLHDFRQLDVPTRLLLTWLHAGRLHNTLARAGVDEKLLRQAFQNSADAIGIDIPACDLTYWHDAAHPRFAGRLAVLLRGLGAVLRELPAETSTQLRLTHVPWGEKVGTSALMLLHDATLGHNVLGSFLGGDAVVHLQSIFDETTSTRILPNAPSLLLRQAISDLETAPENMSTWQLVSLAAGDKPLPGDLRAKINTIFETTDFAKLLGEHSDSEAAIFHFISGRILAGLPSEILRRTEQQVSKLVDYFRRQELSQERLHLRVNLVASCLISLAVVEGDEAATFQKFYKSLSVLATRWPEAVPLLRNRFRGWPTRQPLARQRGLWELELTLRALA